MRNLKKFLALVLALMMVVSVMVTVSAADYTDQADIDYDEAVAVMTAVGMVEGGDQGQFDPDSNLTRAQAATLIVRLLRGTEEGLGAPTAPFIDVPATHWAAGAINYCSLNNLIDGDGQGHFYPDEGVTGVQMAKLLLVALGYDSKNEGFTGADWERNVATIALGSKVNMLKGGNFAIDKAEISRQEACLMAFNTIQAQTVEYSGGTNVTLSDGTTITVNATRNYSKDPFYTTEYNGKLENVSADGTAGATDEFDRPTTQKWTYDDKSVYDEAAATVAVFTDEVTEIKTVNDALTGYQIGKAASGTVSATEGVTNDTLAAGIVSRDGVPESFGSSNDSAAKRIMGLTGNGKRVEVYANAEKVITKIVVIEEHVRKLIKSDFIAATDTVPAHVNLSGASYPDAGLAVGDIVLYTVGQNSDGDAVIGELTKLEPTVAKVTHTGTTGTAKYIRLDGAATKYYKAATELTGTVFGKVLPSSTTSYDVYTDSYGYVVYLTEHATAQEETALTYYYVIKVETRKGTAGSVLTGTDGVAVASVVDPATGETSVIDLAVKNDNGTWKIVNAEGKATVDFGNDGGSYGSIDKHFVAAVAQDDGKLGISVVGDGADNSLDYTQGGRQLTTETGDKVYVNADTKLTVVTVGGTADAPTYEAETITGYTNFQTLTGTKAAYTIVGASGAATNVYVVINKQTSSAVYGIFTGDGETSADGAAQNFLVNGQPATYYWKSGDGVTLGSALTSTNIGTYYKLTVSGSALLNAEAQTSDTGSISTKDEVTHIEDDYIVFKTNKEKDVAADYVVYLVTGTDTKKVSVGSLSLYDEVKAYAVDPTKTINAENPISVIIIEAADQAIKDTDLATVAEITAWNAGTTQSHESDDKKADRSDLSAEISATGELELKTSSESETYFGKGASVTVTLKAKVNGAGIKASTADSYAESVSVTFTYDSSWTASPAKVKVISADGTEAVDEITLSMKGSLTNLTADAAE